MTYFLIFTNVMQLQVPVDVKEAINVDDVEATVRELVAKFAPELTDDDSIPEVLDSLSAMDLTASLGEPFGITLPLDTTDRYSTIPELIDFVISRLKEEPTQVQKSSKGPARSGPDSGKLAILGFNMAVADAAGVEELHDKLASGRRSTSYEVHNVEEFDAEYFGIGKVCDLILAKRS